MKIKTGIGYDVHCFADDRKCILGGVEIPHARGLLGHSDADVLSHAIADALLGALGLPDIGFYFPPTDPSIEGISSLKILEKCRELCSEHHANIQNVDSTIIAEAPKIMPHLSAMKEQIAIALGISTTDIGIKATTNEKMGFVGREEGIAAMATTCIIIEPDRDSLQ